MAAQRPPIEEPEPGDDRSNRFGYPEDEAGQPMYWDDEGKLITGSFVDYLKQLKASQKGDRGASRES